MLGRMTTTSAPSTSDRSAANATTVRGIYEAVGRGDIQAVLDVLASDVAWDHWDDNTAQKAGTPHLQPRTGPQEVAGFFAVLGEASVHHLEIRDIVAGDAMAVADVLIDVTFPNGGRLRDDELHRWTFGPDGSVTSLRHYVDTAKHIAAAMRGQDTVA